MSFSEWKEIKLVDVCKKIGSGVTPRGGENVYKTEGVALIRSQNVYDFTFEYDGLVFIDDNQADKMKNVEIFKDDILLNITGDSVARCCKVPKKVLPARVNQHVSIIRPKEELLDPSFLQYYLLNRTSKELLLSLAFTGGTRKALTKGMIESFKLYLPSITKQEAIAATLSCLDDKIELNNKINKNLEEMAQAIFKSWFVDFEPFQDGEFEDSELGRIPKGWRVGCIGDYVKVKSGYAFKSSWWQDNGVPVIKIKEIDNYTVNFSDISYVSEDKVDVAKDFKVSGGDLLIAMTGATIGKFAIVPKLVNFALVNQRVGKFFLGENPLQRIGFIYCILKQDEIYNEIVSRGDGSAQPNISPSGIEKIRIVLPSNEWIDKFNSVVKSIFEKKVRNTSENQKLTNIRDSLLPKLMSGEIRVPVEEVQNA